MKRLLLIFLMSTIIFFLSCAGGMKSGFMEPTSENSMLIVGRIIIDSSPERTQPDVTKGEISVAILGVDEQRKAKGYWTETDENGYFALADVPKGNYAIKAVRANLGMTYLNLVNTLQAKSSPFKFNQNEFFTFKGNYFPFDANGRIVSFKHNVFQIDEQKLSTYPIPHAVFFELKNYELANSEILNDGPVELYFMKKYPTSKWYNELERSSQINKMQN